MKQVYIGLESELIVTRGGGEVGRNLAIKNEEFGIAGTLLYLK